METSTKLVKTLEKGQITIPAAMRRRLGIGKSSYLRAYTSGSKLILEPVRLDPGKTGAEQYLRSFSNEEIAEWLELDRLDEGTRKKAKSLLK